MLPRTKTAAALSAVFLVLLVASPGLQAATITVDQAGGGDYTDIPDAVFAAAPGDTIEVAPGEYTGPDLWGGWWLPGPILHDIRIIGSGPSTRIVRPCFEMPDVKFGCYILKLTDFLGSFWGWE